MEEPMRRTNETAADGARGAPRTPGQRAGLVRGEVLARARSLAGGEGLERVTMRRLAAELGVAPNALYTYFPDKAALLDAIFDDLLGEIEVAGNAGGRWQDDLAELMRASRRLVLAHPGLATLFLTRPGGANGARLGEATFRRLERGGVVGGRAVMALRALLSYTLGFAAMEVARLAEPERGERSARARERMGNLAPESFRATRALAPDLAAHADEEDFEAGLRWLIDGIAAG
jgi:TetR/AcrR family transcriptional regulator, tetracycline repressor protein